MRTNFQFIIFNFQLFRRNIQQGQIVLILVLLSVVGLTIGLSLIGRTITDIRISHQVEESSRAFSAAEAGIETALRGTAIQETGNLTISGAAASYKVEMTGGTSSVYSFPVTDPGAMQSLWFMEHKTDGSGKLDESSAYSIGNPIGVCWGLGAENNAALVMTLIYRDEDDLYKIAKAAYDPGSGHLNNFLTTVEKIGNYCDGNFRFRKVINGALEFWDGLTLNPGAKLIALSLQPVYQATAMAVKPDNPEAKLPYQGKQIISLGTTDTGIVRKIQVTQGFPLLPEIFNFSFCTQ